MVDEDVAVVANDQSAEPSDPCERAFDDPTALVAAKRAAILSLGPVGAVGCDEFDTAIGEPLSMGVAVVRSVALLCGLRTIGEPDSLARTSIEIPPVVAVLRQNVPNPFNPNTQIEFSLSGGGPACLSITQVMTKA